MHASVLNFNNILRFKDDRTTDLSLAGEKRDMPDL